MAAGRGSQPQARECVWGSFSLQHAFFCPTLGYGQRVCVCVRVFVCSIYLVQLCPELSSLELCGSATNRNVFGGGSGVGTHALQSLGLLRRATCSPHCYFITGGTAVYEHWQLLPYSSEPQPECCCVLTILCWGATKSGASEGAFCLYVCMPAPVPILYARMCSAGPASALPLDVWEEE